MGWMVHYRMEIPPSCDHQSIGIRYERGYSEAAVGIVQNFVHKKEKQRFIEFVVD